MNSPNVTISGLARRLVRDGLIDEDFARQAIASAQKNAHPLPFELIGKVSAKAVCQAASDEFGTPVFDLSATPIANIPNKLVDPKLVSKHRALPLFKRGNRLFWKEQAGTQELGSPWLQRQRDIKRSSLCLKI